LRRKNQTAGLLLGSGIITAFSFGQSVPSRSGPGITEATQAQAAPGSADARAEFEVATIKPSDPDKCCSRYFSRNGRQFATANTNLKYLIQWAWNLQAKQVAGPDWMDQARFDVAGEMSGVGTPTDREWKSAVQQLLIERFQLKLHHESREMPAFALTVAKGGAKLTPTAAPAGEQHMGFSGAVGETMRGIGVRASIADFVGELQRIVLDRPIVDRTGLTGEYDIQFSFTREDNNALGMTQLPDNAAPNLITALDEQLGLKLAGVKTPVDVLVIDHAEPPSAN
jgi:uncharacterized protein (TIGR03435 family)